MLITYVLVISVLLVPREFGYGAVVQKAGAVGVVAMAIASGVVAVRSSTRPGKATDNSRRAALWTCFGSSLAVAAFVWGMAALGYALLFASLTPVLLVRLVLRRTA